MKKKNPETEGEELIRLYLEEENIDFEQEKEIPQLNGDEKVSRVADFYLPQYKVYIEFFGQWNSSDSHKDRYRVKKKAYWDNNIPCIYLYPENLGILDFVFKRRLKDLLVKRPELKWQLLKLNKELFFNKFGIWGIVFVFLIFYVSQTWLKIAFSAVLLLHIYNSLKNSFLKRYSHID